MPCDDRGRDYNNMSPNQGTPGKAVTPEAKRKAQKRFSPRTCRKSTALWVSWFWTSSLQDGEGNGTHSSTLAWKIPWTEEPGRLQSMGSLRVRHNWVTSLSRIGGGNGNPLQCSCLQNPRDGGARWSAIYGVAQSWTWLKQLSSSSSSLQDCETISLCCFKPPSLQYFISAPLGN